MTDEELRLYRNDVFYRYQRRQELEELIYNRYKPLYVRVVDPNIQALESLRESLREGRRMTYYVPAVANWRVPDSVSYSMDLYSMRRNCYTPKKTGQSEEIIDWKHEGF